MIPTSATIAPFRCGQIAVIGRPNVGKSTLVNALVGSKVSIVSNRPQTTRHRLLGIATFAQGQLVLVDTPGLHRQHQGAMQRMLNRAARGALDGVDVVLMVVCAGRWQDDDADALAALAESRLPAVLAVNQIDLVKDKIALFPYLQQVTEKYPFAAIHPLSARKRTGLDALVNSLLKLLPEQPALYADDDITDRSQRFLAAERVREQLMRQLGKELPYATTVEIESFVEEHSGKATPLLRIGAVIWVERESQKAIVIGTGGARLKSIGQKAREQIERLFGVKVFLQTWVRVRAGWSDDETALRTLGYSD